MGALVPILAIELALIVMYFTTSWYVSGRSQESMLADALYNLQKITTLQVNSINQQLRSITETGLMMQQDHETFFKNRENCYLPNGEPHFAQHANGAYYKTADNGGSSLYYASTTKIGPYQERLARCSESLDPMLKRIVEANPSITQAYLNTWDDMNRLYPFMKDAPGQYGSAINMEDYNFYFDADAAHNPARKPVWTGAYLDPAGQGWMVSLIAPIYNGDVLEGVSGLDVTIDSFVKTILGLDLPWDAGGLMVDRNGMILAMDANTELLLNLRELKNHVYQQNIKKTVEKPEEYNILRSANASIRDQLRAIFNSGVHAAALNIGGKSYVLSQEQVAETGWRIMILIDRDDILAPVLRLKQLSTRIGYTAVGLMVLFYAIFFYIIMRRSTALSHRIALPLRNLSAMTQHLGAEATGRNLPMVGISEIDQLSANFNNMTGELETRTAALVESQLAAKVKEREAAILAHLARHDPLTGAANRLHMMERAELALALARRHNRKLAVLFLDLDGFKTINDNFGHEAGDALLVELAKRMIDCVRDSDIVCRTGGDEFVIVLSEIENATGAAEFAERLGQSIEQPFLSAGRNLQVGVSIGIAVYPDDGNDIAALVSRADQTMYVVKKQRNAALAAAGERTA